MVTKIRVVSNTFFRPFKDSFYKKILFSPKE